MKTKEENQLSKSFRDGPTTQNVSDEDINYDKVMDIFDSFVNIHNISKEDFLKKVFVSAFKLIPEAEKGSFYELSDDKYTPIFTKGYDFKTLQKLIFNRTDAFIDYECSDVSRIDAHQIYIKKRDETKFSKEIIDVYSCGIAIELGISEVKDISTAALLHDIGKIGISTEILNKSCKLTEDEYNIIKQHPIYTKTILEKISNFATIANIAYSHHENYDGTGYPQGLKGDQIPFESQIIQVADAYDAMTSERAYRKALSKNEALEILEENMGKQFNPEIAKVAIKLFAK